MSRLLLGWHTLLATAVLLINDWILKNCCRSVFTGKISDFAGVYLLGLLIVGIVISISKRLGSSRRPDHQIVAALVILAAAFSIVKTTQTGMSTFLIVNGLLATASRQLIALIQQQPLPRFQESVGVVDPTDLLALTMLPFVYFTAIRRGVLS